MKKLLGALATAVTLAGVAPAASADVLTFDGDLTGSAYFGAVPYHGFMLGCSVGCDVGSWFYSDDNTAKDWYKSPFHSVSTSWDGVGDTASDSLPIAREDGGDFYFSGAWFTSGLGTAGDVGDPPLDIQLRLFNNGVEVANATASLVWDDPSTWLGSGYSGLVDEVRVYSVQGFFGMDNFEYRLPSVDVPEPSSLALSLLALAGVGAAVRRKPKA